MRCYFHGTARHVSLLARRPLVLNRGTNGIEKASRISHHARCRIAAFKLPAPLGRGKLPPKKRIGFGPGPGLGSANPKGPVYVQDSRPHLNQLLWARCIDPNIARCARSLAPGAQLSVSTGRHKWQATKGRNGDRTVRTGVQSNGCIVGGGSAR